MATSTSTLMSPDVARAAIRARHMTQAEAAKLMGYSSSALNRFLNGSRDPSKRMAKALEETFGNHGSHRVIVVTQKEGHSFGKSVVASGIGNAVFYVFLLIFFA